MRQKDELEFAELLNRLRQNQLTERDFAVLSTRTFLINDSTYRTNATHLFVGNALVDNFNLQYISKLCSQKFKVKAVDIVCGDLPASVKSKLLNSLLEKQSDTANLAKEVILAVGMKYDLTANIEVTDGLTNGSTCELKLIESKIKSLRPIVFNNSRSLHAHFNDLKSDPNNLDADVIGIAESRLISTDENDDIYIPGFEPPVRLDQRQTNSYTRPPHGLVLYYRSDCILHNTVTYSTPTLEFVITDIISSSKGLFHVVFCLQSTTLQIATTKGCFPCRPST
ncbi:unnamed protein product [Mytilus coruscus]|uniref:Uncharacterized protein n=1 Tax=Mytilus coruscus TaxID=42192 RepID=A0A6J8B4Q3_MYTCO|nr:unnamed protein product [Mytilus coruscus]